MALRLFWLRSKEFIINIKLRERIIIGKISNSQSYLFRVIGVWDKKIPVGKKVFTTHLNIFIRNGTRNLIV